MPRKQHLHHYIYKTTCLITNRYYVGMHSTSNLDDDYIGSGKRLWNSINKHGRNNHKVEILEFLPDRKALKQREKELVNEDLLKDPMCMNLQPGGVGGFVNIEHANKCQSAGGKKFSVLRKQNPERYKNCDLKISIASKRNRELGLLKNPPLFTGKNHTQETKNKISDKAKLRIKNLNSQFGTCWIYNENESKKIKNEDLDSYLNQGWIKGRKMKF